MAPRQLSFHRHPRVLVASQNIANVIVTRGPLVLASSVLIPHHSLASAVRAVARLTESSEVEDDVINAAQPPPRPVVASSLPTIPSTVPGHCKKSRDTILSDSAAGSDSGGITRLVSPAPPLLPLPVPAVARLATVAPPQSCKSFLNAVLSPAKAPPRQPRQNLRLPPATSSCFRCLAADHQGDLLLKNRLAFAFLDNPAATPDISSFIDAALGSACPGIRVELLPSSRGVKLLRFANNSDRERLRALSPISFGGLSLSLERPEETSNRFIRTPEWLALVALTDFPPEQWSDASIRRCFTAGAEVLEINPDCLDGHNYGPLQLVLQVNHYLDIPYEILVSEPCGLSREGSLVQPAFSASTPTVPGGVVTAWDSAVLELTSSISRSFSLTTTFSSHFANAPLTITNVYAPSNHQDSPTFLDELSDLLPSISGPWLLIGDFNMLRGAADKNQGHLDNHLCTMFNSTIDSLVVAELQLQDCLFTWSNMRSVPTLARLDRAFVNNSHTSSFPSTSLTTLPRQTSDHKPLLVSMSTSIPKSQIFRFENAWLHHPLFLPEVLPAWHQEFPCSDAAARLAGF
ncbi:hypothetical protein ZEAMMB73_Zm00001d010260 [Zea mays]|uniref:Endonuclease/exonuclease/phosphatase domain-containing protein n=1 Tax=Zea mays TaxID=4577 RepID=A0A1D6FQ49_MAIZE|nr:hypothetical protein ZEAMMB73_Zm00001d010260 [Zea mays]